MREHQDRRRHAYCDLFDTPGDVNLFVLWRGAKTCWHRHQRQTDQFMVIQGDVLLQRIAENGLRTRQRMIGPISGVFTVPPGEWHGYENIGQDPAFLLMYLSQKYDPTDEERMSEDEVPWDPA